MWLTDLLRKLTKGPNVGETFRDYIGCYLYGIEGTTATTLSELEQGLRTYLQDYVHAQPDPESPKVQLVQALLDELPARLQAHVQGDLAQPLLELDGALLFVRKGVRQRRKENGRFVE